MITCCPSRSFLAIYPNIHLIQIYRMTRQQEFDFLFKIVMIGDSGVGKSNLLSRFVDNVFNMDSKPTIGVQFATKTMNIDGKCIKNQIWDTAGQERFRAITNAYYRGAVGAIITFDLTKAKSFQNVQKWLGELKDNAQSKIVVMLVGNKSDLSESREVKSQIVDDYAQKNKLYYLETSAATGANVNEAFTQLIKQIYLKEKAIMPPQEIRQKNVPLSEKVQKSTMASTQGQQSSHASKPAENLKLKSKEANKQKKKGCC